MNARINVAIAEGKNVDDATAKALATKYGSDSREAEVQAFIHLGVIFKDSEIEGLLLEPYEPKPEDLGAPTLEGGLAWAKADLGILGQYLAQFPDGRPQVDGWADL